MDCVKKKRKLSFKHLLVKTNYLSFGLVIAFYPRTWGDLESIRLEGTFFPYRYYMVLTILEDE